MAARYKRSPKEDRTWNGRVYDSKLEMVTAQKLHTLQAHGKIFDLKEQVPFELVPKDGKLRAIHYRADFTWIEDGELVVGDAKGHRTQLYTLKYRLMKHLHGITIREL
jgi:hypothetical protein